MHRYVYSIQFLAHSVVVILIALMSARILSLRLAFASIIFT